MPKIIHRKEAIFGFDILDHVNKVRLFGGGGMRSEDDNLKHTHTHVEPQKLFCPSYYCGRRDWKQTSAAVCVLSLSHSGGDSPGSIQE